MEKLSSKDWSNYLDITVLDPDGWDRTNFDKSWEEEITLQEFLTRLSKSTINLKNIRSVSAPMKNTELEDWTEILDARHTELANKYNLLSKQRDNIVIDAEIRCEDKLDVLRNQISSLKAELKAIGKALDDPRTDLTHTMTEIIVELKQQFAAEKVKAAHLVEEILRADSWLSSGNNNKALIQVRVLAGLANESYLNCIGRSAVALTATEPKP